ncbi:DUF2589 domain-containing protein [Sessilibacter corallicola]|uniref:DUF2589 domain-containing protein n=1 Tax=Sessilibacter corallicola TaxID=2904075 RepID=UPI001E498055|nr:DUF2589 domain-containing protein [Sessilibacter corallicola]MCE2029318.1 DUF2589 domain-containing protein [Sessilibacter corallicola]
MIKFESLVRAIHKSINDAAKSVEADGIRHLEKFFYQVDEKGEPIPDEADDHTDGSQHQPVREFKTGGRYQPKTVSMEFPVRKEDSVEIVEVEVPLIVLSPISTPKVTQAKFTAEMNVSSDKEGNIQVDFAKSQKSWLKSGEPVGNTRIELTIEASESPEGLQKVIDGYERALRAQIPG